MRNAYKFCSAVLEKKIFKGLHQINYVQIVFVYYFADNVGGTTILDIPKDYLCAISKNSVE